MAADNPGDDKAKKRFMLINLMRIAGVAMVVLGLAIIGGAVALPQVAAWVLIALGLVETFVTPQVLARMWSSDRQP